MTPLRRRVLALIATGHTNAQIARRLGCYEGTVRDTTRTIFLLLGARDRTHAVVLAVQHGLLSLDPASLQEVSR